MNNLKRKRSLYTLGIIAGIALVIAGLFLKNEELKTLAGVFIGVGAGMAGMLIALLVSCHMEITRPEFHRARRVENNDERMTLIREKAGARTNFVFQWILFVVTLVLILVNTELYIILVLAGLMLLNGVLNVVLTARYNKRY